MSDKIVGFIIASLGSFINKKFLVFLISMCPILELRGGLIAAALLNLKPVESYILCIIGNIIPIPFILWFMNKILIRMRKSKKLKRLASWLDKKVDKNKHKLEKYGYLGLILFVGIPLPGTGAWTGCMVASVLELDKKKSLISAIIGVFIASIIMMILSFGIIKNII